MSGALAKAGRGRLIGVVALGAVLLVAAGLQLRRGGLIDTEPPPPRLGAALPRAIPGWEVRDFPLGETETVRATTEVMLKYDDYVFRSFRRGDTELTVYIAYWGRNKMPAKLVAQHTPDACWTQQGWVCRSRENAPELAELLPPLASQRKFVHGDAGPALSVAFWHLADGEVQTSGSEIDHWQWWAQAVKRAARGSPVQYFVRLASNRPLEETLREPDLRPVVAAVTGLGRAADRPGGGN